MTHGADSDAAVRRLSSRQVYANPWLTVREDEIERSDGSRGIYAVVDKPDFALIIPAERDGFWLIEQHRYPVGKRSWEFPQGTFAAGIRGTQEELARSELAEETGLTAGRLVQLGRLSCAAGMSSQWMDVFLATDLTPGEPSREMTEQDMRHAWISRGGLEEMIRHSEIIDDATVAAYGLLLIGEREVPSPRTVQADGG